MPGARGDGLRQAFERIDDFVAVQSPLSSQDLDPILCLWEAAGIGNDDRALLADRVRELAGREHTGGVALGVLIGLFATQLTSD
jgi:hypothetical protein